MEYAQKFRSTPGKQDGLYWETLAGEDPSPFGLLVARAHAEGYESKPGTKPASASHQPFHGYLFKILMCQGKHAPGGKYNYLANDHLVGGFALLAYPVVWGNSGVMTFVVNQQG